MKVNHQAWKIMPQTWIRGKEVGEKVNENYKFGRSGKKWKKEREFFLGKRMLQNQSTI